MNNETFLTSATRKNLIDAAQKVRQNAYIPYSHYAVGAALLSKSGVVYTGCNVENASYPLTICAERAAVVKAVSDGITAFEAIMVVTSNGGFPCGACRQVLYEFAPDMLVMVADANGNLINESLLRELLPHAFGPW